MVRKRELRRACVLNPSDANAAVQLGGLWRGATALRRVFDGSMRVCGSIHFRRAALCSARECDVFGGAYEEALAALRRLPNPEQVCRGRIDSLPQSERDGRRRRRRSTTSSLPPILISLSMNSYGMA